MTVKVRRPNLTPQAPPWEPLEPTLAEIAAVQALMRGDATDVQQRNFVQWLERTTGADEMEFRAGGERESNFAAGKRFIGLQFRSLSRAVITK